MLLRSDFAPQQRHIWTLASPQPYKWSFGVDELNDAAVNDRVLPLLHFTSSREINGRKTKAISFTEDIIRCY